MQDQLKRICLKPERTGPIPPTPVPTPVSSIKTEEQPKIAVIPSTMVMPKWMTEECSWKPHCSILTNDEEHEEDDWDGNKQNQPKMHPQKPSVPPKPSAPPAIESPVPTATIQSAFRVTEHSATTATEFPESQPQINQQSFDISDRYTEQIKVRREWGRENQGLMSLNELGLYRVLFLPEAELIEV